MAWKVEKSTSWKILNQYIIFLVLCFCSFIFFNVFQSSFNATIVLHDEEYFPIPVKKGSNMDGFLIKTSGCRIPYMNPFDYTVKEFIFNEKKLKCSENIPPALVDSNSSAIFFQNNASIADYVQMKNEQIYLHCCYQNFTRKEPKKDESDNEVIFYENCIPFQGSTAIKDEFIRVQCDFKTKIVYEDYFSFVPIKRRPPKSENPQMNVLVIGIDAVSRLNFHRQMPKTVEYLKNLSATEFVGYNKVGDNTFPNLIPVLTGLTEDELNASCWHHQNDVFDKCPFIWKNYSAHNFVTSFGEDSSWMGVFNYQRNGFKKQPTDYMWGTFDRLVESKIGNAEDLNVFDCIGARQTYQVFLRYIYNFVETMTIERLPYFAFYWGASLSHDKLNRPKLGDDSYLSLFEKLQTTGALNNTALVVMSDHGIRWGSIRSTFQGQMEERLPFLFLVLPDWFKKRFALAANNLMKNSQRLTTPFDLHETLKSLLQPHRMVVKTSLKMKRGYSLFEPIPETRTCKDAAIASHWCTCQRSENVSAESEEVIDSANSAINFINKKLEGYAQCAILGLANITNARVMSVDKNIQNFNASRDFMIIFETVPGNGVFETTVRRTSKGNDTYHSQIMGTIGRLNLYGSQSACITDFHLKLYCYCIGLLNGVR